ncbi:hypothetical protein RI129_003282 [Pyrocoelia pectoralis]|uniref:Putative nuclease HARBI1 n=1 Tax=Pyrocoelia pectoralis TaxID=417401 RepID=A0AAN7VI00_9COLE
MSDLCFFQHFRLTKETVLALLPALEPRLEYVHDLNNSVSPINQLLLCLRYYATGCHQLSLAYFGGMHKSTVNRIVKRVTEAICHLRQDYINFPRTPEERVAIQYNFFEIAGFPRVTGAIDCTHIRIQSPGGEDGEIFRNRKGHFSLNVQAVVDASYKFLNIVARWPGSTHDATIFRNCMLRAQFERNDFADCVMLGDSGYAIKPYLLTPLLETRTRAEQRYNESHIRTRVIVENTFGIWKRRFPILAYGCRTKVPLTMNIIVATAILHNIARNSGEDLPPNANEHNEQRFLKLLNRANIPAVVRPQNNAGFGVRNHLINNYFNV